MPLTAESALTAGHMKMPVIGFGTGKNKEEEAIEAALEAGYRHIDTAYIYGSEMAIGNVLKRWINSGKLRREEVFITTKLPMHGLHANLVDRFLKKSLETLQLDYVDLYLIHWPMGTKYHGDDVFFPKKDGVLEFDMETDHIAVWKAMEDQVLAGRARAIGTSNFTVKQLEKILNNCSIPPANNQVEMHVHFQRPEMRAFCLESGITVTAYSPLGCPAIRDVVNDITDVKHEVPVPLKDPVVLEIAKKHGRSPGNILLRFLLQLGVSVIPKSSTRERIMNNMDIFGFHLDEDDMTKLKQLDRGEKGRLFGKNVIVGSEKHPECPFDEF